MKLRIILRDDCWREFRPITTTRPTADILAGSFTFLGRLQKLFPESSFSVFCRPEVGKAFSARRGFLVNEPSPEERPILLTRPNVLFSEDLREAVTRSSPGTSFVSEDRVVAALLQGEDLPDSLEELDYDRIQIKAQIAETAPDLVNINAELIELDFREHYVPMVSGEFHPSAAFYGKENIYVSRSAEIMAGAVLDARSGPIIVEDGAEVGPGVSIQGPCYIGPETKLVSGWIRPGCSFGPACRIGGEVEASIFNGYSNKYHEGFVGYSLIGEWVNLGALTTTSDLKNNYGEIRINMGDGERSTGRIKLGSFIGDHSKTGIGALLNSGTVIGAHVNHYGTGLPPKFIPDFSWGSVDSYVVYQLEKALETARKVMLRRGVEMLPAEEELYRGIFRRREEKSQKRD